MLDNGGRRMEGTYTQEELAQRAAAGDDAALWELYEQVKRMMFKVINRYTMAGRVNGSFDYDDLTQIGMMAFYDAVKRFDADRGGFLNMMSICVNHAMQKELYIGRERIESSGVFSLDAPASLNPDNDNSLIDTIIDEDAIDPCEGAVLDALCIDVRNAVAKLPPGQREVIEAKYWNDKTNREICEDYNISHNVLLRRERRALTKLRATCRAYDDTNYWRRVGVRSFLTTWSSSTELTAMELIERDGLSHSPEIDADIRRILNMTSFNHKQHRANR